MLLGVPKVVWRTRTDTTAYIPLLHAIKCTVILLLLQLGQELPDEFISVGCPGKCCKGRLIACHIKERSVNLQRTSKWIHCYSGQYIE